MRQLRSRIRGRSRGPTEIAELGFIDTGLFLLPDAFTKPDPAIFPAALSDPDFPADLRPDDSDDDEAWWQYFEEVVRDYVRNRFAAPETATAEEKRIAEERVTKEMTDVVSDQDSGIIRLGVFCARKSERTRQKPMEYQVLFYHQAKPVTKERHRDWFVETGHDYGFARRTNSVPLMAVEFPSAGREYAIVFAVANGEASVPVAILGIEDKQNLYVTPDGGWTAHYIPAFVRRYPFIFATDGDGKTFTLCIDEGFAGCNQEGHGRPLFDDNGGRTEYLENVLKFLQQYQAEHQRTHAFIQRLKDLKLLEPMQANVSLKSGEKHSLAGFQVVSREKLGGLPADVVHELFKSGALELIYSHLQSLANFGAMVDRLAGHRSA